jgi:hypothetical protein
MNTKKEERTKSMEHMIILVICDCHLYCVVITYYYAFICFGWNAVNSNNNDMQEKMVKLEKKIRKLKRVKRDWKC